MIKNIENYNEIEMRNLVSAKLGVSIFDIPYIQSVTEITRWNVKLNKSEIVRLIRYWKGGKVQELELPKVFERDLEWEQELKELIRHELELTPDDSLYEFEITNNMGIYPMYTATDREGNELKMSYDYVNEKLVWYKNDEIVKYDDYSHSDVIKNGEFSLIWDIVEIVNKYRCTECDTYWEVESDCSHDDECPTCGTVMTAMDEEEENGNN